MKLGKFDIQLASDGPFMLDAGAIFGIVPKPLWSKVMQADEHNRIALGMNVMVVRFDDEVMLVECGTGRKHSEKLAGIYGLSDDLELVNSLAGLGVAPEDVTAVILTHLHLDHAGSCTKLIDPKYREEKNKVDYAVPTFPNARYYVQRGEWEAANNPNPATRGTYRPENFVPLQKAGKLMLLDGDDEIFPGISVRVTGGHTDHHQVIVVQAAGQGIVFVGDAAPIVPNLKPAWNTAFDHHPIDTMRAKAELFELAMKNDWLVWFYHEPESAAVTLTHGKDQPEVAEVVVNSPTAG